MNSVPDPHRSQMVDLAVADFLEAVENGAAPDRETFLAEHPEIADELRQFLDDYQAVNGAMPGRQGAGSTHGGARSTGGPRKPPAPMMPLPCSFAGYELLEEIARGGMGVVYKARQRNPDRTVALKMILAGQLATQADLERFSLEAQAAAALDHPHIVPIFEVGQHEGQHYFTMGYVAGVSLAQKVFEGPLPAREAATIVADAALAAEHAHRQGIIHRDLKPANILIEDGGRVRVTDFGLAKRQTDASGLTCTGQLLGTPSFMSPEQVTGDAAAIGPASDVYALGATLYTLVTGRPPFQSASTIDTLKQVIDCEPVSPRAFDPSIPRDLETITLKCLAKAPASRYTSAHALADDLHRYLDHRPIVARRSTQRERFARWCRRNPLVASLAATAVLTLIVGATASTAQAIRATRAETLAETRFAAEREARQAADKARAAEAEQRGVAERQTLLAEAQRTEAVRQRAAAEQNYGKAKATVDRYFTLVSDSTLLDVPKLEPLRIQLTEAALDFYKESAEQRPRDPQALADMAATHLRLSSVYLSVNQVSQCFVALERAADIIDELHRDYPNSEEYDRRLAGFWKGKRWTRSGMRGPGDILRAVRTLNRLEKIIGDLADKYPDEIGFRFDLGFVYSMLGAGYCGALNFKKGIEYFEKARVMGEECILKQPNVPYRRADLAMMCNTESMFLYRSGRIDEAAPIRFRAIELAEALVAEFPNVPAHRAVLAEGHTGLAIGYGKTDPAAADRAAQRAIELGQGLVDEYPGHVHFAEILCIALDAQKKIVHVDNAASKSE